MSMGVLKSLLFLPYLMFRLIPHVIPDLLQGRQRIHQLTVLEDLLLQGLKGTVRKAPQS